MFGLKRDGAVSSESNEPVNSADEWLTREGHTTWPLPIASEGELDLSIIEGQLETKESLMQDLRDHTSFDMSLLDEFGLALDNLGDILNKYASQVLEINSGNDTGSDSDKMVQGSKEQHFQSHQQHQWQKRKSDCSVVSRKWNIESAVFPGFRSSELPQLPGSLEAPQLLNKVTTIQHFNGSFKRLWKQYFLSEATVAIFQDIFWWWFLYKFQPNPKSQAQLFNRIADSFVGLFLSITSKGKDFFFQKFADCLAQAIYAAFCESFPMSFNFFDDDFREDLLQTISEWFTGTRLPPGSWKSWNLDLLEAALMKSLQEDRTQQLKSSLSFNQNMFLELDAPQQESESQPVLNLSQSKLKRNSKESHQAGPGPQFQRVSFNIQGKSPLISHFLSTNGLQIEEPAALKTLVTRTEVEKFPQPFPTYQDLINERKKEGKLARKKYLEAMAKHAAEEKKRISAQKTKVLAAPQRNEEFLASVAQASNTINQQLGETEPQMEAENSADGFVEKAAVDEEEK